jgi:ATP-binding cassette, subfamily C, bacterial
MSAPGTATPGAFLGGELARRRRALVRLFGWSLVGAAPAFVSGRSITSAVDHGFLAGRPWWGVAWLFPLAVAGIIGALSARRVNPLLGEVVEPLRDRLVRHIVAGHLGAAVRTGSDLGSGSVSQLVGQTESVRDVSASLLGTSLHALVTMAAAVAGLASLDVLTAGVVLAPVIVTLAVVALLVPTLAARTARLLAADERVAAVAAASMANVRDIVACGAESRATRENAMLLAEHAAAARSMARAVATRTVVGSFGAQTPVVALLAAAPWLVGTGRLTVGGVLGGITYATVSMQPALRAAVETAAISWVRLRVTLQRLLAVGAHDLGSRPTATPTPTPTPTLPARYDLRAEGLRFSYAPDARPIVTDLHLDIPHGEHVAVVGPSGVGKSTLADLLCGLTAPAGGVVRLGGLALDDLPTTVLRSAVALVPQEAYVFAGTLAENLRYLRPGATTADLDRAAAAVGLTPLVARLGGYDAVLDGDHRLSEGERQLVVLARAWLSAAEIVVLDEGTCHLDPHAEARAEMAFRDRHGTLVVVAHRITSARRADRILVMDAERVVTGSHDDLVTTSPLYADLVGSWGTGPGEGHSPVPAPQSS